MRCVEVDPQLDAYVAGATADALGAALAEHLAGCPDCAEQARRARRLASALDGLAPRPADTSAVRLSPPRPAWRRRRPAAAVVLLALLAGLWPSSRPQPAPLPVGQPTLETRRFTYVPPLPSRHAVGRPVRLVTLDDELGLLE